MKSFEAHSDCSVDLKGKRVAVVGTGATGIQLSQEVGKEAAHMTLFQRTPNLCLPMRQRKLTKEEQDAAKPDYPDLYKHRMTTFAGFAFDFADKNTFDDNEEQRQAFFEDLWDKGKSDTNPVATPCPSTLFISSEILIASRWLQLLACYV